MSERQKRNLASPALDSWVIGRTPVPWLWFPGFDEKERKKYSSKVEEKEVGIGLLFGQKLWTILVILNSPFLKLTYIVHPTALLYETIFRMQMVHAVEGTCIWSITE